MKRCVLHARKFVLTETGLPGCFPLRIQHASLNGNHTGNNNMSLTATRRTNNAHRDRYRRCMTIEHLLYTLSR